MVISEKYLEKKLKEGIKKKGGLALKFSSEEYTGMPDRLILMPNGKTYWVEVKSSNKDLRKEQKVRCEMLRKMGYKVFVVKSMETLDLAINADEYGVL